MTSTTSTPLHDWLRPRLAALVAEAVGRGFPPDAVVATLTDLAETEDFAASPPPPAP